MVTALETVRKPTAAVVDKGKRQKNRASSESKQKMHFKQVIVESKTQGYSL